MNTASLLIYGSGFGHHAGGVGEVGRVIAHSIIWTVVSQFVRAQPVPVMLILLGGAALFLIRGRRGRARRVAASGEWYEPVESTPTARGGGWSRRPAWWRR